MGPEDHSQVPWSPRPGLHPVMEGWTCLQCHHSQEQVSTLLHLKSSHSIDHKYPNLEIVNNPRDLSVVKFQTLLLTAIGQTQFAMNYLRRI